VFEGTWTDDYGQEYHNYTYTADSTIPDDVGYTAQEYTDEWNTNYYQVWYDDGAYF
jgi:hypothetical protein